MSGSLVRSVFSEDGPEWDRLEPQLREWVREPRLDLSDIRELVYEFIVENFDNQDEDEDACDEAMNVAFSVVDEERLKDMQCAIRWQEPPFDAQRVRQILNQTTVLVPRVV